MADKNEQEFLNWFHPTVKRLGLSDNPDDPDYDYRAFYREMRAGHYQAPKREGDHWPSAFKSPNHSRRYLRDPETSRFFDTESGQYTGGDHSYIDEEHMNRLNNADVPDLSKTDWALAKAGFDTSHPEPVPALIGGAQEWLVNQVGKK